MAANRSDFKNDSPKAEYQLIALDAAEQLRRWDAGRTVWTIEMGGLGPGYEQAIQLLAIEIMRDELNKPLPEDGHPMRLWADDTVTRLNHNGFSGAQVGAAKQLAYKFLKFGPAVCLKQVAQDRHIQVSNHWPTVTP